MTDIIYTNVASDHTVKPTQTKFTNSTGKDITLRFENGTDLFIEDGATSEKTSKTIQSINYGAEYYYSAHQNNYTIDAGKTATIERSGSNLVMKIP